MALGQVVPTKSGRERRVPLTDDLLIGALDTSAGRANQVQTDRAPRQQVTRT
jgi:hypothetical protein